MRNRFKARQRQGFTIIELLVVIAILAVLSAIGFSLTRKAMQSAEAVDAISRIRQHGMYALSKTGEDNGRLRLFIHGTGNYEETLLYRMLDEGFTRADAFKILCSPAWEKDGEVLSQWRTWGTNGDDRLDLGVEWAEDRNRNENGSVYGVFNLFLSRCHSPADYPLFADSSDSTGWPKLRFANERWDQRFAMRYGGKGPIFFMDGSTQMVRPEEMGRFGITVGYLFNDSPVKDPERVTAEDTSQR